MCTLMRRTRDYYYRFAVINSNSTRYVLMCDSSWMMIVQDVEKLGLVITANYQRTIRTGV